MTKPATDRALRNVFLFQGAYFIVTGIWPLLNMESFLTATGPKQDTWLVEMVGLLAASIGLTFVVSSLGKQRLPTLLGYAVATSFLIMDIVYFASGVMGRIYLLDAAIQFVFIMVMTLLLLRKPQQNKS